MNFIFLFLILIAFAFSAFQQFGWVPSSPEEIAPMEALTKALIDSAKSSVDLAIGLVGVMAFFLGLMKVAEKGGLLQIISRLLYPVMKRLFPDVPADHPAMGAMIMNISANVLGLANAATPFGIRAMQELDKLNKHKGTATNAMVLFLAINTSSVTLLPTGVIGLRASMGSANPAGIMPTTLFATVCSTLVAVLAAKLLQRFSPISEDVASTVASSASSEGGEEKMTEALESYPAWISYSVIAGFIGVIPLTIIYGKEFSPWVIPLIVIGILLFGWKKKVRVYETFVEGAKDGFQVALMIIPYLVAILCAVGMFRASGALDAIIQPLSVITNLIHLPAEALPMALLRPLSGSGAYGVMTAIMQDPNIGPDSYIGYLVSTIQGSTETTFYVLAVYFGAVQVQRLRHALPAALAADVAGVLGAVFICYLMYGS